MLAYVRPMLACVGRGWLYVEPMLAYVGPTLAYVGPMWSHLGGYVGDMLAILGLCWGYVRPFMLKNSSDTTFSVFSFRQSQSHGNTIFQTFFYIAEVKFSAAEGPQTL